MRLNVKGEAEAAMSQISELVDLMYDPSPQASPVKERNQRPAQLAAIRPPAQPSSVFDPAMLVPKKDPKPAKPRAKKTQVAPRKAPLTPLSFAVLNHLPSPILQRSDITEMILLLLFALTVRSTTI